MIKKYLTLIMVPALLFACGGSDDTIEDTEVTDKTEVTENIESNLDEMTQEKAGYEINDYATDFSLMNIDDQLVSLSDYEDAQGFIIVFTCNHCPYAVAYEDRIVALDKKYKELGYPVIAINPNNPEVMEDDSFEKMKERAAEKGFTFPYLLDDGQEIYPQYGATKTPHVYILEKLQAGNRVAYIGTIDDNYEDESAVTVRYVEDAVDALLNGDTPPVTETVAIGCSIKS
jgi:peroxiredoxin